MIRSLHGRLLLTATVVMAVFLGLTGFALDNAFQRSAVANVHEQLKAQMFGLLAIVELDQLGQVVATGALRDSRFSAPDSGLFAWIVDAKGRLIWRSGSTFGVTLPEWRRMKAGERQFSRDTAAGGDDFFVLRYGVRWESPDGSRRPYTFVVAEDLVRYSRGVKSFRRRMIVWLTAATLVLLVVQTLVSRWALAPLRRVAEEVRDVERGRKTALSIDYPREVFRLTDNINRFIRNEREHLQRYRHTLDDLAHSLKTPLAVLRGLFESSDRAARDGEDARDQVDRMTKIVEYQLRRAATSGHTTLAAPVDVGENVAKVLASLHKVYADKTVATETELEAQMQFYGDAGDLLEILGNLLDNAFKYCRGRVRISGRALKVTGSSRRGVTIEIEDDGPGIPDAMRDAVTGRGVRAPSYEDGQGIGLAVVNDVVQTYGGSLELSSGSLGGTLVRIRIEPA